MTSPFNDDPITVTKLEAARRQLKTAIDLWFNGGDEVSTLALAYASHEVIHRLYRNKDLNDLIFDSILIEDEDRSDFSRMLKEAPNFFKHAKNEDANTTLTFRPINSAMFLMMSGYALVTMGEVLNDVEQALMFWFALHFPNTKLLKRVQDQGLPVNAIKTLTSKSKKEFFEAYVRVFT